MSDATPQVRSPARSGSAAKTAGAISLSLVALGIVGIQVGVLPPLSGFYLFALGGLLGGLLSLCLGAFGLIVTRDGNDPAGRRSALIGGCIGAALLGAVISAGAPGRGLPPINDITTNLQDPPSFVAAAQLEANLGRDMSYPEAFTTQVAEGYPDLAPIRLELGKEASYAQALAAADRLGWEITFQDSGAGVFEARSVSRIFRFVDDVAVRVRATQDGSVIDVRSKSRDGRGDLGANANRIRSFASTFSTTPAVASPARQ